MILLPRAAPQLARAAAALKRAGYKDILPFAISAIETIPLKPAKAHLIVLTSANVVPAVPAGTKTPVACVGAATARAARKAGLNVIHTGRSDGTALALLLVRKLPPRQALLHLHGDKALSAWHAILTDAGHTVRTQTAYRTRYVPRLPAEVIAALKTSPKGHVLLFSPGSANHLRHLIQKARMRPCLANLTALALSPNVAQASPFPNTLISPRPTLKAMLSLLAAAPRSSRKSSSSSASRR